MVLRTSHVNGGSLNIPRGVSAEWQTPLCWNGKYSGTKTESATINGHEVFEGCLPQLISNMDWGSKIQNANGKCPNQQYTLLARKSLKIYPDNTE